MKSTKKSPKKLDALCERILILESSIREHWTGCKKESVTNLSNVLENVFKLIL